MTQDEMQSELAYLKSMAENGARAPSIGGRFSIWWGALAAIAFTLHWAIVTGVLGQVTISLLGLWVSYIIVGSIGSYFLGRSLKSMPGTGSPGNRHSSAVWQAMGAGVLCFFFVILLGVLLGRFEPVMFNLILPVAFLGYGIGWLSTAMMNRSYSEAMPGLLALIGMGVCLFYFTDPVIYLVAAITALVAQVVPGVIQMTREPKSVV